MSFFSFFQNFDWGKRSKNFDGVKGQKMAQSDKNSVALHISEIIHHMIVIYGTHV